MKSHSRNITDVILAEFMGWRYSTSPFNDGKDPFDSSHLTLEEKALHSSCWVKPGNDFWEKQVLPNFSGDLNLIRTVEAALSITAKIRYTNELMLDGFNSFDGFKLLHKSAEERAAALVKVIS